MKSTPPAVTAKTTMNRLKKLKEEQAAAIALEKKNWVGFILWFLVFSRAYKLYVLDFVSLFKPLQKLKNYLIINEASSWREGKWDCVEFQQI